MSITIEKRLPDPASVRELHPLLPEHRIDERRGAIERILRREDTRKLLIVGPCSAWPTDAVREYADRLTCLQEDVREHLLLVMRVYIQKPRTTVGWSGPLNMPDPLGEPDIERGIGACRKMMHAVAKQLPIADEMLFTHNGDYFDDLLSYVALGARSGEDSEHRYVASGHPAPVGIKHSTGGDIQIGVNGIVSVQHPHTLALHGHQVRTSGNPHAHLILRGGGGRSNFDPQSIAKADKLLRDAKVLHPAMVIDASHENSLNGHGKDPSLQPLVIRSVLLGIEEQREEYAAVAGFMAESFLRQGSQKIAPGMSLDGCSITDPCLGWDETQRMIRKVADTLDAMHGTTVRAIS